MSLTIGMLCAHAALAERAPRGEGILLRPTENQIQSFFEFVEKREPSTAELTKTERFLRENPLPPASKPLMRERAVDVFFEKVLGRNPTFSEVDSALKFLDQQELLRAAKDRQRAGGGGDGAAQKARGGEPIILSGGPGSPGLGETLFDKGPVEFAPSVSGPGARRAAHGEGQPEGQEPGSDEPEEGGAGPAGVFPTAFAGAGSARSAIAGESGAGSNVALARELLGQRVADGSLTPEEAGSILKQITPLLNRYEPDDGATPGARAAGSFPSDAEARAATGLDEIDGSAAGKFSGPRISGADAGTLLPSTSAPEGPSLEARLKSWSVSLAETGPVSGASLSPLPAAKPESAVGRRVATATAGTAPGAASKWGAATRSALGGLVSASSSSSAAALASAQKAKKKAEQWIGSLVARLADAKAASRLPASGAGRGSFPAPSQAGVLPHPSALSARTAAYAPAFPSAFSRTPSDFGWDAVDTFFASAMALVALRLAWLVRRRRGVAPRK